MLLFFFFCMKETLKQRSCIVGISWNSKVFVISFSSSFFYKKTIIFSRYHDNNKYLNQNVFFAQIIVQTFELQELFDVFMHHFPVMWEWELPLMSHESSLIKQKKMKCKVEKNYLSSLNLKVTTKAHTTNSDAIYIILNCCHCRKSH